MNICLVSYHYDNAAEGRPNFLRRALSEICPSAKVVAITSDFDHIRKSRVVANQSGIVRLHVRPYRRNISFKRALSYVDFAAYVYRSPLIAEADIVLICVPDYLSALALLWKRRACHYRIVIDVVDLWPEALPFKGAIGKFMKNLVIYPFKWLRGHSFSCADMITFQSEYFRSIFGGNVDRQRYLPMCGESRHLADNVVRRRPMTSGINIAFLGSINNICDIDSLVKILLLLSQQRSVHLTIVGGGEGLELLQMQLKDTSVHTTYHGISFDSTLIEKTLMQAHFGYNGYKAATEVAVSYKSLQYLKHGVPLLNSTKGDTLSLVENDQIGFNFNCDKIEDLVGDITQLSDEQYAAMSQKAGRTYDAKYSYENFSEALRQHLSAVLARPSTIHDIL